MSPFLEVWKSLLRDIGIGLSTGILYFFLHWNQLTTRTGESRLLFYRALLTPGYVAALWTVTLALAAVSVALLLAGRAARWPGWMREGARLGWLVLALLALKPLRHPLGLDPRFSVKGVAVAALHAAPVVAVLSGMLVLYLAWRYRRRVQALLEHALLLVSPIALYCVYLSFVTFRWDMISSERRLAPARQPAAQGAPRILVSLFDEWDYAQTFPEDGEPRYAELAALRERFLFATHARSPHNDTEQSIPAYLTGERVRWTLPESPTELRFATFASSESRLLGAGPTIFHEARSAGYNLGVIAFYLPYCRVFGPLLSSCLSVRFDEIVQQRGYLESLAALRGFGAGALGFPTRFTYELERREAALRLADLSQNFLWFHWSVPHAPAVDGTEGPDGYRSNYRYVAEAIGDLRKRETEAWWDESLVILTSDHSWRFGPSRDPRIPFFVKFPGQKKGARYDRPFNTIVVHRLLAAAVRGQLPPGTDPVRWLDENAKEDLRTYPKSVPEPFSLSEYRRWERFVDRSIGCRMAAERRRCPVEEKAPDCRISDEPAYCDGLSFGYL